MMKRITYIALCLFLMVGATYKANAQDASECNVKYNLFRGDYKAKKYDLAYDNWLYCLDNCPKLTKNIYINGEKIAKHRYNNASEADKPAALALVKRVYEQRIENYPSDLGKVYGSYATFMNEAGAPKSEVFELLQKAFDADKTRMGGKNIYMFFDMILNKNKDTNVQKVFDTYDDVSEGIEEQKEDYIKKISALEAKKESGQTLTAREKKNLSTYEKNLSNNALIEAGLDKKIAEISTCERLIPLYRENFEANKANTTWLKRAIDRMDNKDCTEDPLYVELVEAYVALEPSKTIYLAKILLKNGKINEAIENYIKAADLETDKFKKAKIYLRLAIEMSKKGRKSEARKYARLAIQNNPKSGDAYFLIGSMYASSANSCGSDEFEKRMVYVAALNKMQQAKNVDPSIAAKANRYIKAYKKQIPTKKSVFVRGIEAGSPFKINCWIGETVSVPK
ncbi:tetratricopeptide repeat protein [Aureivirga sp. CE67]|uniref:tetratricopeptide repeat protein n=1 Tax=Aureivirga sp. CE67 TaxID=1788983 RepID=UPI001E33985F|nr:hypothetical protein [Aureivirga sp. CE67]